MNAVSATILIVLLLVVCFAPRRWALLAMMAGAFCLTQGHSLDIGGLNIYPVRILEMAAFGRVLARRELVWSRFNRIDWTLLGLYNYVSLVWLLRSPRLSPEQIAFGLDASLCYLALRSLIREIEDVHWFLSGFAVLLIPYTALVFLERMTGEPAFAIVGAIGPLAIRDGTPRCQGSFRHAILLGSVAASFLPLYIAVWRGRSRRLVALVGGCACLTLVILSKSGGPLTSAGAALLGWAIWLLRERMRLVRRSLVALLIVLAVFMKAPIWYLPFKISAVVGGGGYHRGSLMEHAWQDLDKWWLAGMEMQHTASWFPYIHTVVGGADLTNEFVVFGVKAGLPAIVLSIMVLTFAFGRLGKGMALLRSTDASATGEPMLWGLGVALLVHIVSWLGVAYFDQSWMIWLMHLAAASAVSRIRILPAPHPAPVPTDAEALRA